MLRGRAGRLIISSGSTWMKGSLAKEGIGLAKVGGGKVGNVCKVRRKEEQWVLLWK